MLPEKVEFIINVLWHLPLTDARQVLDTELLQLCRDVEETLTDDDFMRYLHNIYLQTSHYREGMYWYESFISQREVVNATLQQKAVALAQLKGIEI